MTAGTIVRYQPTPQDGFGGAGDGQGGAAAIVARINSPANLTLYVLRPDGVGLVAKPNVPQGTGPGCWFVPTG